MSWKTKDTSKIKGHREGTEINRSKICAGKFNMPHLYFERLGNQISRVKIDRQYNLTGLNNKYYLKSMN